MKAAAVTYHRWFPESPISGWVGVCYKGWVQERTASGQLKRPRFVDNPFLSQRALWCRLHVHFQGVDLVFALPQELDQFLAVMGRNPLPSGGSLVRGRPVGRPNNHWLSRLPGKAKTWKFRQAVCRHLRSLPEVRRFRAFYASNPPEVEFDGFYDSFWEASAAGARTGVFA